MEPALMPLDETYPDEVAGILGRNVLHARTVLGLSIRDLAGRSDGVSLSTISRVERGGGVTLAMAAKIAAALGITLPDLMRERE
jgi:transcriptional regulator with XRE-family HTH domain